MLKKCSVCRGSAQVGGAQCSQCDDGFIEKIQYPRDPRSMVLCAQRAVKAMYHAELLEAALVGMLARYYSDRVAYQADARIYLKDNLKDKEL